MTAFGAHALDGGSRVIGSTHSAATLGAEALDKRLGIADFARSGPGNRSVHLFDFALGSSLDRSAVVCFFRLGPGSFLFV
jgi:hypothetical protein